VEEFYRRITVRKTVPLFQPYRRVLVIACLVFCSFSSLFAYSGGSGTESDPYQIAAVSDWNDLMNTASDWNKHFIMTADINLQGIPLIPVGRNWPNFNGVFDGNGHTIRNADINMTSSLYVGLFGYSNGQIRNLGVVDVNISGRDDTGGLMGYNNGTIIACFVTGSVNGNNGVGGLVGRNGRLGPTITDCYAIATVTGSSSVGGLAGANNDTISDCYAAGTVTGSSSVGGLVGINFGNISNSSSTGSVAGQWNLGGLVGQMNRGSISGCFSTAAVTGIDNSLGLGGLVGMAMQGGGIINISNCYSMGNVAGGNNSSFLGGLIGKNMGGAISNCFATGDVNGTTSFIGGLIGASAGNINSSYFLITSAPDNNFGEPLTDEQMKQQTSFAGWDFVGETENGIQDIWKICNGTNYPKLAWQKPLSGDFVCPDGVDFYDFAVFAGQWSLEKLSYDIAPPGGDGIVNFLDYALFANNWQGDINSLAGFSSQWLKSGAYSADIAPAPAGDCVVNMLDFAAFADNWLKGI